VKYRVMTTKQIRALDKYAIRSLGVPELVLMENAGKEIFNFIAERVISFSKKKFLVLSGCGNNGGDAMVVARHLFNHGILCTVVIIGDTQKMSRSARVQKKILQNMQVPVINYDEETFIDLLEQHHVCIDGILGIGFSRKLRESVLKVIEQVNSIRIPVLSIDVPSGLNADNGKPLPEAIKATWTITLGAYKKGLFLRSARPYVGKLRVVDIGLPVAIWSEQTR
jgi:hydroxyethylthiazole kinase-like uncharacterized protein yjeF